MRLGFRCNQDCHFCWQSRNWPVPPEELHFIWLEEMYKEGVKQVVFTGGEPTFFKGFVDLLQFDLSSKRGEYGNGRSNAFSRAEEKICLLNLISIYSLSGDRSVELFVVLDRVKFSEAEDVALALHHPKQL